MNNSDKLIGLDFGGAERARASSNWEMLIYSSVITTICSPNILVSSQYFWQVYASG